MRARRLVIGLGLVGCVFILVGIGVVATYLRNAAAHNVIRSLGGEVWVRVDVEGNTRPAVWHDKPSDVYALSLRGTRISDADLKALGPYDSLRELSLVDTAITGDGLRYITSDNSLRKLSLGSTQVGDDSMLYVAQFRALHDIDLSYTKITDDGLKHLRDLPHVQTLYLTSTQVTDKGMVYLNNMKLLSHLDVSDTRVTDAHATQLLGKNPRLDIFGASRP